MIMVIISTHLKNMRVRDKVEEVADLQVFIWKLLHMKCWRYFLFLCQIIFLCCFWSRWRDFGPNSAKTLPVHYFQTRRWSCQGHEGMLHHTWIVVPALSLCLLPIFVLSLWHFLIFVSTKMNYSYHTLASGSTRSTAACSCSHVSS